MIRKRIVSAAIALALSGLAPASSFAEDKEFGKALRLYNSGKYRAAIRVLQASVAERPHPAGYYLIGYSLYELREFTEASTYFEAAYLIDPDFSLEKAGLISKKHPQPEEREGVPQKPEGIPAAVPAPQGKTPEGANP